MSHRKKYSNAIFKIWDITYIFIDFSTHTLGLVRFKLLRSAKKSQTCLGWLLSTKVAKLIRRVTLGLVMIYMHKSKEQTHMTFLAILNSTYIFMVQQTRNISHLMIYELYKMAAAAFCCVCISYGRMDKLFYAMIMCIKFHKLYILQAWHPSVNTVHKPQKHDAEH